ncbi:MAG: hypothetical protein VX185_16570 [Pseudomonadota bacterium]|nr:hypothetical protein [Pseudomonadota bacterium]
MTEEQDARLVGMVNLSELLINIVSLIKPKSLTGFDQNGMRTVIPLTSGNTLT